MLVGVPDTPGRVTGSVRGIRQPDEFADLQPCEILVTPLTSPAWTPLFNRAAAVVTDVGSAAAHASIIAREFGIPAVGGCGEATARPPNRVGATGARDPRKAGAACAVALRASGSPTTADTAQPQ